MSVCVVSFSSRKNGNCARIGELVRSLLPDAQGYHFTDFDIHPCGGCNGECFERHDLCPWIYDREYELLDAITHSELTYFILPNYSGYPCANFFIFNERSLCYFQGRNDRLEAYERVPKRAIVVSNTDTGQIREALRYHADGDIPTLVLSASAYGRKSVSGDLMSCEAAVADVKRFVLGE